MEISPAWVGIGIGVAVHLTATVWWASKVNTLLAVLQKELKEMIVELKSMKNVYVRKEDVVKDHEGIKFQINALWKKVDFLYENKNKTGG